MRRRLCSAILVFEALVMLLAIFVVGGIAGWLALACVVTAGLLGRPWGYGLGHVVQAAMVALGFLSLPVLFIAVIFAGLWVVAYVIGMRIDRDRAGQLGAIR